MRYDPVYLKSLVGGLNTLDVPHLSVQTLEQAREFAQSYGYDPGVEAELNKLWGYHRKAVTFIQTELLKPDERIPEALSDPNQLVDVCNLLLIASTRGHAMQTWACGLLKVMHVFVHLDNDLFTHYSSDIQEQILKPVQAHIFEDSVSGVTLGTPGSDDGILLKKFEIKPFKATSSSVTKLLAKPELVAFSLMDKLGVRFVAKHLVDVFRVLRYLLEKNIVCFPHGITDQTNNTLYPLNLFFETMESLPRGHALPPDEVDGLLYKKLEEAGNAAEFREKFNAFTSSDYRFMKFITRRLVRLKDSNLTFFYPYEVQIVDYQTYLKNMTGEASHDKYKERQVRRARARILGFGVEGEHA